MNSGSRVLDLSILAEQPSSPDAQALIAALDADLALRYPPELIFGLHEEDHDPARMVFLVARAAGRPVACGALRTLDAETGEVKRMYVVPDLRGRGLSRRMLAVVESIAVGRRHRRLLLETGNRSPAALALYRSSGYLEIPAYGEYAGNAYSVCFEKVL
jgi:putative acetyltransferase